MAKNGTHLQHVPALDGLRGIAVAAVVAFHVGLLRGGWLGVDLFFVLSGYLISRLLFVEQALNRRIDLKRFWSRRARRLLPALLCVILVVAVAERLRGRLTGAAGGRWDVVGALTYTSNWVRLRGKAGYWSQFGPPSLLEHFWSLAIEEQFYLVWPLVMLGVTRLRRGIALIVLLGATLLAGAWALILFDRTLDASRVYMGTDTRAVALLAGATVACLGEWRPLALRRFRRAALPAFVGLVIAMAVMNGTRLVTYQGGLMACTLAATVVVAGAAAGPGPIANILSGPVLRWLGSRSYGIYLWHWPILVAFGVAGNAKKPILGILFGVLVSLIVAEISYRAVEMPIRRKGLATFRWRPATPLLALGAMAAAVAAIALPLATPKRAATASPVSKVTTGPTTTSLVGPMSTPPTTLDSPTTTGASKAGANPTSTTSTTLTTLAMSPPSTATSTSATTSQNRWQRPTDRPTRIMIVGDSVGLYLGEQLQRDQASLTAEVRNVAVAGCPPSYAQLKRRNDPGSVPLVFVQGCADHLTAYPTFVSDFKPDVTFVVFGASLLNQNEIAPDVWSRPCDVPFDTWYHDTLVKMSAALSAQGGRVVLVSQAYYRSEGTERTPTNDREIDCENRVALAVASNSPSTMRVADLASLVCPTATCIRDIDGIELRPDGTHFKDEAAALVNRWLLQQTFP